MRDTLQFLVDNICADFTVDSLLNTARACISNGKSTVEDVTRAIMNKDHSLDINCARGLAEGVLLALTERGELKSKK